MSEELDYSLQSEGDQGEAQQEQIQESQAESNENAEQSQSETENVNYDLSSDDEANEAGDGDLPEGIKAQIGRRNKKIASLEAKLKRLEEQQYSSQSSGAATQDMGAHSSSNANNLNDVQNQIPISDNGDFYDPYSGTYLNINTTLGQNAYYNNLVQHNVSLQRQKEQQEQAKKAEEAERQKLQSSLKESMAKSSERFSDYWDVVGDGISDFPEAVQSAITLAPNGGDLAYWLKRNPSILKNISQLGKYEQAQEALKHAYKLASYNKVTKAQEPTKPLGENTRESGKPSPRNLTAWKDYMRNRRKR